MFTDEQINESGIFGMWYGFRALESIGAHGFSIGDFGVEETDQKHPVKMFCSSGGLIGLWMLRAEQIACVLTGKQLWPCAYRADKEAIGGVVVDTFRDGDPEHLSFWHRSHPVDDASDVPPSLRLLIMGHAIRTLHAFAIDGGEPRVRLNVPDPSVIQHGQAMAIMPNDLLVAQELNTLSRDAFASLEANLPEMARLLHPQAFQPEASRPGDGGSG